VEVADRAISVRLDEDAERALQFLMRNGQSRSEAIRSALIAEARRRKLEIAAADAARVAADPKDRREIAEVQALMEDLRAEG
jgi:Arc/MetJ-type ribon-helix-helix transcriptional regulator